MYTTTDWAWDLMRRRQALDTPLRLTLLAFTYQFDKAAAGRDMFDPQVLEQAVTGIAAKDLVDDLGVTAGTARNYCRRLAASGLLTEGPDGRFHLPHTIWTRILNTRAAAH